jgi:hypothetical protein
MRFLFVPAPGVAATLLLALACSSNKPSSTGDDTQAGTGGTATGTGGSGTGGTGGHLAAGGGAGVTTGGTSSGSGGSGATTTGGSAGSGATSASGGTGGTSVGGAGTGGTTGVGGSAGTSPSGGTGGTTGGTAGSATGGTTSAGAGGTAGSGAGGEGTARSGMAGSNAYGGTVILSDNFDASGTVDPKWFAYPDYDMTQQPKIDTTRVHSPPNAIKVTSSSSGSFLMNQMGMGLPAPNNRFYARVWVNFENATSAIMGHAAYLVGGVTKDNSGTELRLGMSSPGSNEMMDLNLQNPSDGGGGEVTRFSNGFTTGGNPGAFTGMGFQYDANRWYCVEALFDGGGSQFQVWVDGTEIMAMNVHDFSANSTPRTMWGPTFNFIKIGGQNFSGTIGNVWYDDVIIGTEQVGCTM